MKHTLAILLLSAVSMAAAPVDSLKVNPNTGEIVAPLPSLVFSHTANKAAFAESLAATYQPLDPDLTALAELVTTPFGRSLLTQSNATAARTTLGLALGSNVQAWDADLDSIAALVTAAYGRSLLTQADAAAARSTLGLGTAATASASSFASSAQGSKADTALQRASAAQIVQNIAGLNRTFDDFQKFDTATEANPLRISFTGFSDSMPGPLGQWMVISLARKVGLGALYTPEFGMSWNGAAESVVYTGTAASSVTYTRTPAGNEITLPPGVKYSLTTPDLTINPDNCVFLPSGSQTEARFSNEQNRIPLPGGIKSLKVMYLVQPGGGQLTATLVQSQYADVTQTVSTSGTAAAYATLDLTVTDRFAPITLEVSNSGTSGNMTWFGGEYQTASGGVGYWRSANGSTEMGQQLAGLVSGTWNPVYAAMVADLNTSCVIHAQRATEPGTEADNAASNYATFFAAYKALGVAQWVFAEPHRSVENPTTTDTMNNSVLQPLCFSATIAYSDRKSLVLASSSLGLGWGNDDNIHRDASEYRYISEIGLAGVNYFRPTAGKAMHIQSPAERRLQGWLDQAKTVVFSPVSVNTGSAALVTATYSGTGWGNPFVSNRRGFSFASGTHAGYSTAVLGQVAAGDSQFETPSLNVTVIANGDRNFNLPRGTEAFLTIGGGDPNDGEAWMHTPGSANIRCYGLAFINGEDLPATGTFATAQQMAIWYRDNSGNLTYGRFVPCLSAPSGAGLAVVLRWNQVTGRLELYSGANRSEILPKSSIAAPTLAATATRRNSIQASIGARNTDWGRGAGPAPTPSAAGLMQWQNITVEFSKP